MKKYELLVDDTITFFGVQLFRIKALISFSGIEKGEVGGYIASEKNLSQYGDAWVYGNARVYGNAEVYGDAEVYDNARVYGNAEVSDNAEVYGDARVSDNADYIVFKNTWSSGRYFTYTKSNRKWRVGCFYGSGAELVEKAYKDSKKSGDFYKAYVDFVEKLEAIEDIHKEQ
nr:MAG TPA: Putative transferase, nesg, ydcK, Structural Genomics.38A [Caudoviricetes sp.]